MQNFMNVWNALSLGRKVLVVGATVAMFAAVLMLSRMAAAPNMTLLYAGLEQQAAGDVVQSLEARGVPYEVRGGAIFVENAQRDQLRMTLASEGLPANNAQGYELLDSLTGFGTTSQMFDAAYWRAKEGELARTIVASPRISQARVHIANTGNNPFQRDVKASASVSVTTNGATLESGQAKALKHLVASAVPGLEAADVAIIDSDGQLVSGEDPAAVANASQDRSEQLRERVQRLVEARVGPGNAVVEVSVETVTETEQILEKTFDPESRVAISTDTEERTNQAEDSGGGNVTVASNVPDGDGGGGDSSSSQNSETRERVNYEVSETTREILRAAGAIKRVSVAVLVNGTSTVNDAGEPVFAPLPDAELTDLRELVASAVGFEEARGDQITIKSLEFEKPVVAGTEAVEIPWYAGALDPLRLIQMAVLAVVALILGLFVVRPVLSKPAEVAALPRPAPGELPPMSDDDFALPALTGEIADDAGPLPDLPMVMADDGPGMMGDFGGMGEIGDDPVERLRGLIEERKDETVQILQSWLDESEEAT